MKKFALLAAVAGIPLFGSAARGDFQFNLSVNQLSSGTFSGDDQWVLQVLNDGNNGTGTNLLAAAVTMLSLNPSTGAANPSGLFYIRTWDPTSGTYNTTNVSANTAAAYQNEGASNRPGTAGSYVSFAGGWMGASTPDETSQTYPNTTSQGYTDGQGVVYNPNIPNTSPLGAGLGGNFNVVGTTTSDNSGVSDTTFQTLAVAVVPHGQQTTFDVTVGGTSGNGTQALILGLAGDTNFDNKVNLADLNTLTKHWNLLTGGTWSIGDFNGDGKVNLADLNLLTKNWNTVITPQMAMISASLAPVSVPEPAAVGVLATAATAVFLRRRRRA